MGAISIFFICIFLTFIVFILAIVSLIHEAAKTEVNGYIAESYEPNTLAQINANMPALQNNAATGATNTELIEWITRIQMTIALDADSILKRLLIDESNIDGALLQLTSFVIQEFFTMQQKKIDFKAVQPLAGQILQTVLAPHIGAIQKQMIQQRLHKEQQEQS